MLEFDILEVKTLMSDSVYILKDSTTIRVSKKMIYIYKKNQYLKIKK